MSACETPGVAGSSARSKVGAMVGDLPRDRGALPLVRTEADILPLALEAAARCGDPNPELVQHITGLGRRSRRRPGHGWPAMSRRI